MDSTSLNNKAEAVVALLQAPLDHAAKVAAVAALLAADTTTVVKDKKKPGPAKGSMPKKAAFQIFQAEKVAEWHALKAKCDADKTPYPNYKLWLVDNISAPWAAIKENKDQFAIYQAQADAINASAVSVTAK